MSRPILLGATALVTLTALPAHAGPTTVWELFTIDRVANLGAHWMVTALRGVADVTYAHMDLRPLDGRMVLTGLHVSPYEEPDCDITVDRAVVQTAPLDQIAYGAVSIEVMGAEVGPGCFSESDLEDMAQMGLSRLVLDRGHLDLDYRFSTGAMSVEISALSEGLAELHGLAEFDYFAVNIDAEEPVADLAFAALTVTDRGGWGVLSAQIPPQMLAPEVLLPSLVDEMLPQWRDPNAPPPVEVIPEPTAPSGDKDQPAPAPAPQPAPMPVTNSAEDEAGYAFLEDAVAAFTRFTANPGTLRLEFAPEAPVRLTEGMFEEFGTMVLALSPTLMTGAEAPETRVSGADLALLEDWMNGGDAELSGADILRYANAFITGVGAPRDAETAMDLLTPLLQTGNPEAIAMALDSLDALDPEFAYRIARDAAAQGNRTAFAQLDRLEAALDMEEVVSLQEAGPADPTYTGNESASDLRDRAIASLTGLGAPRRYSYAYFYALLALASGDEAAASIVDEIEAMGDRMSDDDAGHWAEFLGEVHDEVDNRWFAMATDEAETVPETDQ